MRTAHAEKMRERTAAKAFLRSLAPAVRTALTAMEVGAEGLVFLPSGRMAHMLREDDFRFRVREVEDEDAATRIGVRWLEEERAAEAVQ